MHVCAPLVGWGQGAHRHGLPYRAVRLGSPTASALARRFFWAPVATRWCAPAAAARTAPASCFITPPSLPCSVMSPEVLNRAQKDPEFFKAIKEVGGRRVHTWGTRSRVRRRLGLNFAPCGPADLPLSPPRPPPLSADQRQPHARDAAALDRPPNDRVRTFCVHVCVHRAVMRRARSLWRSHA